MLADPGATADDHLRRQHRLLREQIDQRHDLLAALEKEMEARQMGISLTPEEQFEVFGTDKVGGEWAARPSSGGATRTPSRESHARTGGYTKATGSRSRRETDASVRGLRRAMRRRRLPVVGSPRPMVAGRRRTGDGRRPRFYDCGYACTAAWPDVRRRRTGSREHCADVAPTCA